MKVFKFGGGILDSAKAIQEMAGIVKQHTGDNLVVVVSALNKMTNALEGLIDAYMHGTSQSAGELKKIKEYHYNLAKELFEDKDHRAFREIDQLFTELETYLETPSVPFYDFEYDQVVCFGELLSSLIVSNALADAGLDHQLFDARDLIKTNQHYRAAQVDPEQTDEAILSNLASFFRTDQKNKKIALTQGFIGSSANHQTTTLGREGSDFTAAIIAFVLNASEVVIWKDVPGVLTGDPDLLKDAKKIDRLSYDEAMMMASYGAKVIHPKTIRPLKQKSIPLYVRSFYDTEDQGTLVHVDTGEIPENTSFMVKKNQALVSVYPSEFSFISAEDISKIFGLLHKYNLPVNLMQNTALRFTFCIDHQPEKTDELLKNLDATFDTTCTCGLEVITVRHYNAEDIKMITTGKTVIMEQRSPITAQVVVESTG